MAKRRRKLKTVEYVMIGMACGLLLTALLLVSQRLFLKRQYPLMYTAEISEAAEKHDIDPYLVIAVMHTESSFRADAVSPAGARGLMQVMPDTGMWIAEKQYMDNFTDDMLFVPEVCIDMGCWYLSYLLDRYEGDIALTVCAYNAGPGAVDGWLEDGRYSKDGMLTGIPYPETERYAEKVGTAIKNYMELYPDAFED